VRYISPEQMKVLKNRLKVGDRKVTVRVEVDKYVYTPSISTEMDFVKFNTDQLDPQVLAGDNAPNITSAALMISPIKGTDYNDVSNKVASQFAVESVNGKVRTHPITGRKKDHNGVDFSYGQGVEIVAVADGVVTQAAKQNETNYFIDILHANGILTRYLHVSPVYVSVGSKVTQGQVIALIGPKDSESTGPHLHFEVRVNSSKGIYGEPRDPMDYLSKTNTISSVGSYTLDTTGVIATDFARLRVGASISDKVFLEIPKGETVNVLGKYGEWYKVSYEGTTGYVCEYNIDVFSASGGYASSRPGGNPSYSEISNYIRQECVKVGLPVQLGYAIAWTESGWTQFTNSGDPYGSVTNDWGIMQINQDAHPSAFPQAKTDWRFNVRLGIQYAAEKFNKAIELREQVIERATYSAYNTGSNYSRYRTENDPRDTRFWSIYQTCPWISNIDVDVGSTIGTVTNPVTSVRSEPNIAPDNTLETLTQGASLEIIGLEGSWYRVRFQDGRVGYINNNHCKVNTDSLTTDFRVDSVYIEDFEKYTLNSIPSIYKQDQDKLWRVTNEGLSNVFAIDGGGLKMNYFQHLITINGTGKLDISFKCNLSDGNAFCVFVDDLLVYKKSGSTDGYISTSIPLLSGTHVIKFARVKGLEGNGFIAIDNFTITQYSYNIQDKGSRLAEVDVATTYTDSLTVNGDGVAVYKRKDIASEVILYADRGQVFPCTDCSFGGWATIIIDNELAYVQYNNSVTVSQGGYSVNQLRANTGGFVYEKTLTLDNVKSITIDRRYELRSATASIVISNEGGYYSPDYNPMKFPEKRVKKSPFVEYYDGSPLGVLSENTPIRIYIGYGDLPQRRFTGLIDTVDIDGETEIITIHCSDMMKVLNDYLTYKEIQYPPDGNPKVAWLASSVVHDLVSNAGLSGWRRLDEDLKYPDIVVEETYYTDVNKFTGEVILMDSYGNPYAVDISSLPQDGGYRNPYTYISKVIPAGTCIADEIDDLCQNINYWQRCDCFGTYKFTPVTASTDPVIYYKDSETLISLMKTLDTTNVRNHLIIVGAGFEDHFFDNDLWKDTKGFRKSAMVSVPWADTYGKRKLVAEKLFKDMKIRSRTMQVVVEGNPYMELLDCVGVEHSKTTTSDKYQVKGIKESWSDTQGYLTVLDLFWMGV